MQTIAGISFDYDRPWAFWFFIGKIISKAFLNDEGRLQWLNAVRVCTREFIAFSNTSVPTPDRPTVGPRNIRVVEVDFLKPQPGENIKLFWKPARAIIRRNVEGCKCTRLIIILQLCELILFCFCYRDRF